VDLSPELYRQLTQWAASAAIALDVPRVALAEALRAMIRATAESSDKALELLRHEREQ
jgi:hypothetical protein